MNFVYELKGEMRSLFLITAFVAMSSAVPVSANSRIKIDTVPATYTPYPGNLAGPVSVSSASCFLIDLKMKAVTYFEGC